MDKLTIEHEDEQDWQILRLSGYVDASTFMLLEKTLFEKVESGCRKLRLDCQNLTHINSTGLGLLLATHRQMRQRSGNLEINGLNDKTANIFNLLGFSRLTDDNENEGFTGRPDN